MNYSLGLTLNNCIHTKRFKVSTPPGPTYCPSSNSTNIDILGIFLNKIPNNLFYNTKNIFDLNSDH